MRPPGWSPAIKTLAPLIRTIDTRTVKVEPKAVDPFYLGPEYRQWRALVIRRAGRRCEATEAGMRCDRAEPRFRMYADHILERRDGGDPLDPANGKCLCARHHTLKTVRVRSDRLARPATG